MLSRAGEGGGVEQEFISNQVHLFFVLKLVEL